MKRRGQILVVDDEANARAALAELLRDEGYAVEIAADGFKALPKLESFAPDVVVTDLKMPGMTGIELMRKVLEYDRDCAVLVMTAFGAVETAVEAMRNGATDYMLKPINVDELVILIERALEQRRLRAEAQNLRERVSEKHRINNIIGASQPMQKVFDTVMQVAASRASVIITGESGTGKELIAAALHEQSSRSKQPFVKLHCAALAESLLESELFGHERGAFTGAVSKRDGRFQQAHGGTLFLDEIGEISPATQVKLLRFLQEHEFERVGGNQTIKVDVRVIAATNSHLHKLVQEGKFREDLYYRLNVVNIDMPALRTRPSDIPALAAHFLERYTQENDKDIAGFTDAALETLAHYSWPGNVRELENAIERAVVICRNDRIDAGDLPQTVEPLHSREQGMPPIPGSTLAALERYAIIKTLEDTGGSTSRAARVLGISPRKIQYRLHQYEEDDATVTAGVIDSDDSVDTAAKPA